MNHALAYVALLAVAAAAIGTFAYRGLRQRQALRRAIQRLERQNEIGRVLLTDRNVRSVSRHVAGTATRLLGCDTAFVALTTEHPGRLVVEAATGSLAAAVGAAVPLEDSLPGWVVRHGEPLVLNHPDASDVQFRPMGERVVVRRAAVLPLAAKGRCVGALGVLNPHDARAFGSADIEQLSDLADYAALTIEAIRALEELRERERHTALINQINSRIRQSLDLQFILETAVRELGTALECSRCYVRLRRGAELLPPAVEWNAPDVAPLAGRPDPVAPLVMTAFRERRTVEAPDARDVPAVRVAAPAIPEPLAVLAVPMVLRGEVVGIVTFHQAGLARLWRAGELGVVEEVAAELAIAISNARLYRSVEEASRELAAKIAELERMNRMKAQFLANMSHELRTPLNSVIGFSDLLLASGRDRLTEDQLDALETISRNGRHLLDLVNDVLDLAKVDAGRMDLNLKPTDLAAVIPGVLAGMESLVSAKGHAVRLELGDAPLVVMADDIRARQVLFNLLSNAVKFTQPGGEITVRAEARRSLLPVGGSRMAEREAVWVAVTDTGIGIEPEHLPRLFTEFTQVDASHARRYDGTGLGLALSKRIMDLHGGRIGVESTKGRGSTFWVEFPVDGPQPAAAAPG